MRALYLDERIKRLLKALLLTAVCDWFPRAEPRVSQQHEGLGLPERLAPEEGVFWGLAVAFTVSGWQLKAQSKTVLLYGGKIMKCFMYWARQCITEYRKKVSLRASLVVLGTLATEEGLQSWTPHGRVLSFSCLALVLQVHQSRYELLCYSNFHSIPAKLLTQSQIYTKAHQNPNKTRNSYFS